MHKYIYAFLCLFPLALHSQPANENIRTKSYQTFVYRLTGAAAEKFFRRDTIDINAFLHQPPFATLQKDDAYKTPLPNGNYVFISVSYSSIIASLECISELYVYTVNNRKRVQLLIIDKNGKFTENAKVWVNNRPARYSSSSKSYWVRQKNLEDEAKVIVYTASDTIFSTIAADEEVDYPVHQQRWDNFKSSRFMKILKWPVWAVTHPFKHKSSYAQAGAGMMVFNQPKYKKTDTVKLKAYLYSRKNRMFKQPVNVFVEYYDRNRYCRSFIKKIAPTAPGSYQLTFPLADTLLANTGYTVQFENLKGERLLRSSFQIEDYLLDDITEYDFRSDKSTYYPGDTMQFYASAKDANGLPLLDANTSLVLTVNNIQKFYKDSVYVPDTLIVQSKKLESEGDTKFAVPANILKDVSVDVSAGLRFINSNNEIQDRQTKVSLVSVKNELTPSIHEGTITVTYRRNGTIVSAEGIMVKNDEWGDTVKVTYPYQVKIDPMSYDYTFYLVEKGKITDSVKVEPNRYNIDLEQVNSGDTLGFNLNNPFGIPVTFTVFYGNKIVGSGRSSDQLIRWRLASVNKNRIYRVTWQYRWTGFEERREGQIAVYDKLLSIDVNSNPTVFPGQKDTITINAKDFRNRPAQKVNLTAFAYNNQFASDIHVPEPPYLKRYAVRQSIIRDTYEEDDVYTSDSFALGNYPEWRKKFALDSMIYYQMLFPENGFVNMPTPISDYVPQVSVYAVKNGEWAPACMLYVNHALVYYSDVTLKMKDVYSVRRGYTQIGIRLPDRFIEIDSIYLQPYYKHDLFIDVDRLPANAKVTKMEPFLTISEQLLLEKSLFQLDETRSMNGAYIWQGHRVLFVPANTRHVVGPFVEGDSIHYFKPTQFDIHFVFEPGYEYRLTKKIARLEQHWLFKNAKYDLKPSATTWRLGDTLIDHPEIRYEEPYVEPFLPLSRAPQSRGTAGKLLFTLHKDSTIKYVVLYPYGEPGKRIVLDGNRRVIENLSPGYYTLMLIDMYWRTLEVPQIRIEVNKTLCLHTEHIPFKPVNSLLWKWWNETQQLEPSLKDTSNTTKSFVFVTNGPQVPQGSATITGTVSDKQGGLPIAGANIIIKHTGTGRTTDTSGTFNFSGIKEGTYTLIISFIGYETKEISVTVRKNGTANVRAQLKEQEFNMQEVVVTAYGFVGKKNLTYSVTTTEGIPLTMLAGRVAGVDVRTKEPAGAARIMLRGVATVSGNVQPVYVIDGVLYDEMPANISQDMISSMNVLNEAAAVAIYGSRAANGAIVITTNNGGATRKKFRDYAFWQPELFTDKNGQAKFVAEYPDNITGWQMFVLAMDKKLRIGKTVRFIKSYKPVWAELNLPRFLVESDSTEIVGKSVNYSPDTYSLRSLFTVNGQSSAAQDFSINSNESVIRKYNISASANDTLTASFNISSPTGFKDGEEQRIPVLRRGIMQTDGGFWILGNDTTVHFTGLQNEPVEMYAQNNTLDVLLNEIEGLKNYPYACNEQTASKLKGLVMEKQIRETLHQKFTEEKTIEKLLAKLLKAQLYDGGWSWWGGGESNIYITNYVINALLSLRNDENVEAHIRNGLLYLQNRLVHANKQELLATLVTMSRARHVMDYGSLVKQFKFDSMSVHQQWQWMLVNQYIKSDYSRELKKLLEKGIKGMLGEVHWGEENYRWYSNDVATTVLAFEVLAMEPGMKGELDGMVQYFLGIRHGYWRNTVESASIVSAVLPYVLKYNRKFDDSAALHVTGDTTFSITKFPFRLSIKNNLVRNLHVQKTGGSLTYLTIFQNHWNSDPEPVSAHFDVQTRFEKKGSTVEQLISGEKVTMVVDINNEKAAEYVMIEIPIPAGCVYGKSETSTYNLHRELLKDKVVLFSENLAKGNHHFSIDLEARYTGSYTLNPSKASLMYFPTFYGRNAVKRVRVE